MFSFFKSLLNFLPVNYFPDFFQEVGFGIQIVNVESMLPNVKS